VVPLALKIATVLGMDLLEQRATTGWRLFGVAEDARFDVFIATETRRSVITHDTDRVRPSRKPLI
jgi:hypothetical protein